jgi:hypothetical protein
MSVSILVVDDEPDVAELFRQRFRREARQGTYVIHFATSGEQALGLLSGGIEPQLIVILSDINMPEIIAAARGHQSWPAIAVLNFLLGWTGVCWIVAVIWSLTGVRVEYGGRPSYYERGPRGYY